MATSWYIFSWFKLSIFVRVDFNPYLWLLYFMGQSADQDQTPQNVDFDQDLHCLLNKLCY